MKLLLFSDLHRDREAAEALSTLASNVDVVVGAGDFASLRQGLATTIEVLQEIDRPAVLVPGNAESIEELTEACRPWSTAHVLHGTPANIAGVSFFGIGGAIPITPFGPGAMILRRTAHEPSWQIALTWTSWSLTLHPRG